MSTRSAATAASSAAPRHHRRIHLSLVVQLAALAGVAALLITQSSILAESVTALRTLNPAWLPVILVAEFSSMAAVARGYRRLLRSVGEDMKLTDLLVLTYASNAIAVSLPLAGSGVATGFSFRQFNRRGVDSAAAGWALLLSGIAAATTLAFLTVLGLAATGREDGVLVAVFGGLGTIAPALAALMSLRRKTFRVRLEGYVSRLLRWGQRVVRRPEPDLGSRVTSFIERIGELRLSGRDGWSVMGLALWNWSADLLCLTGALKAVGAPVPWHGLLLAYVAGIGVGSLNLTPGGIGVVEVALTSALVANGLPARQALAAVLLYRLVSLWLVVLAGWGAFGWGQRVNARERREADAIRLETDAGASHAVPAQHTANQGHHPELVVR